MREKNLKHNIKMIFFNTPTENKQIHIIFICLSYTNNYFDVIVVDIVKRNRQRKRETARHGF